MKVGGSNSTGPARPSGENPILRRLIGGQTVGQCARARGISEDQLHKFLSLRRSPFSSRGQRYHLGYVKSAEALAWRFGMAPESVFPEDLYRQIAPHLVPGNEAGTIEGFLESLVRNAREAGDPDRILERSEICDVILYLLRTLTPRQETVIRMHFGLDDGLELSVRQIAEQMQVSTTRIDQIFQRAMRCLKHPSRARRLRAVLGRQYNPPPDY